MTAKRRNVGASVRERLLRLSQQRGVQFQHLLTRYANERLLHRLSKSPHAAHFVLEGATLFSVWSGSPHRATRDIDLLGFGDSTQARVQRVIEDLIALEVEDDGVGARRAASAARALLVRAIVATFERRGTPLPALPPIALTAAFAEDPNKRQQWSAFVNKVGDVDPAPLPDTIVAVARFAWPALEACARAESWLATWAPGGPWVSTT